MEWMVMNLDNFFAPNLKLGKFVRENEYRVTQNCQARLEEILNRLKQDESRWHFRRSLFMNKVISQNLIPNLIYGKEDRRLIGATIKVLQELMTPVECLMPVSTVSKNGEGQRIVLELEKAINSSKKLFLDTRVTKALIDFVDSILQAKSMTINDCELVNHCLILIRNLFHVQRLPTESSSSNSKSFKHSKTGSLDEPLHRKYSSSSSSDGLYHRGKASSYESGSKRHSSLKNENIYEEKDVLVEDQIMWNLFAQRFDNILIKLLTCPQQHLWNVTMVQLVSLMYREQHQGTIRKLIQEWLELSLCESSTDDENNTLSSSSYDAVSTSDPVSDSSERLSPVEGARAAKSKPSTACTVNSDKNSSLSSQCLNTNSSKDSGLGRSSSNNEGETSVDESIHEWVATNHHQVDNKDSLKREELEGGGGGVKRRKEGMRKSEAQQDVTMEDDSYSKETLHDIRCVFDTGGGDAEAYSSVAKDTNSPGHQNESMGPIESMCGVEEGKEKDNNGTQNRGKVVKKPPDENESYSGDSSEKPPPHPLPKLVKGKALLPGQKRSRHCMSQKMMNETQEMQELSNSTGSDCDEGPHSKRPPHQKPHKMLVKPRPSKLIQKALQERNMKRTKIMKRKESSGIKAKALLHHQPTPEDISNLLKEFTLDFMLNGYATLVQGLRMQVLFPIQMQLDKSHLLWLITYFLRFAVELDLELSQICPVLSVEVVSYLVYEGVVMQEELEVAIRNGVGNLLPHVRRLHLVVTALREFFISFDVCLKKDPATVDSRQLINIKDALSHLVELRQIFVFLIRMYRPGVFTLNYLEDLITTNHRFLITQEPSQLSSHPFDMIAHVRQFATMDMMRQYGRVLENFSKNSEFVNDSIFTMMHHIAGELRAVNVLLQPSILKVFLRIWKDGFELCVDWADLIEYVLRKCTNKRTKSCYPVDHFTVGESQDIQLTIEDVDHLSTLFSNFNEQDLLEKIKDVCCDDSIEKPIKKEVIQKLLARGYISSTECTKLCAEIPQPEPTLKTQNNNKRSISDVDTTTRRSSPHHPAMKKVTFGNGSDAIFHSDIEKVIRDQEELESETKRFRHASTSSVEDHDLKSEVSSLKTLGSSVEANMNSEEEKEHWEDHSLVAHLLDRIRHEGLDTHLQWLQTEVLEACHAKMKIMNPNLPFPEPLFFHFAISSQPIPIVPWTMDQEEAITSPFFTQLLQILGFHLPQESGKIFPRIPNFWGPEILYEVAQKLGELKQGTVKLSLKYMTEIIHQFRMMSFSANQKRAYEEKCDEICDINSSFDCDDSSERVSDCSMQNNRSTSTSPVSSLEEEHSSSSHRELRPFCSLDRRLSSSVDCFPPSVETEKDLHIRDRLSDSAINQDQSNPSPKIIELNPS